MNGARVTRAIEPARRPRWLPTRRLLQLQIVPVLLAAGAMVNVWLAWGALGIDVVFALVAWLDGRGIPRDAIAVERDVPDVMSVGRPNQVTVRLRNRSDRALSVQYACDGFEGATIEGIPARVELAPNATAVVKLVVSPMRRGAFEIGADHVRCTRRGGLVTRQEQIEASSPVRVYPDVASVRQYDAWARKGLERVPGTARMRGGESEFERLRPYGRDDEYRHIDWKATARRSGLMVRQYQTETQQTVLVLLDCGRGMRAEAETLSFLDHALNATLMLAHVAIERGDQVGMVAFADAPQQFVPPGSGAATERKLIQAVYALQADLREPDYPKLFSFVKSHVRKRSLVVLFTQVLDAGAAQRVTTLLRGLMPAHLPLCILLRDRDVDALAAGPVSDPRDLYVRGAAAESLLWRDQVVRDMRAAGVLVIDVPPGQLTPAVVKRYAEIKSRQLL